MSNNCCSGCGGCSKGCYGALNCVAGPLCHCGKPPANNSQYYQNFPFYGGPCPPGPWPPSSCHCGRRCHHHHRPCCDWPGGGWGCGCRCEKWPPFVPSYPPECNPCEYYSMTRQTSGLFVASAPLTVAAGAAVPLEPVVNNPEQFNACEGGIQIRKAGTYMVNYTVQVPPMQALSTTFSLALDGETLPVSAQQVVAQADNSAGGASAQMLVQAQPNSRLALVSSNAIAIGACGTGYVISLSIIRV